MATNSYNIEIISSDTHLKATYHNGKFKRLELLKGKITAEKWRSIGAVFPLQESEIEHCKLFFEGKVTYTPILIEKSTHTLFKDAWFDFYRKDSNGLDPKFTPTDAKQINEIIKYLTQIAGTEPEALVIWQQILTNYHLLSDFYKNNKDLKLINSKLNVIINSIKHQSSSAIGTTGGSVRF